MDVIAEISRAMELHQDEVHRQVDWLTEAVTRSRLAIAESYWLIAVANRLLDNKEPPSE